MNWNFIWKSLGATVLLASSLGAHASSPISVKITPAAGLPDKNSEATVNVTLTNTSGSPLRLPKWALPSGEIDASLFEVTHYGRAVRYIGSSGSHGAHAGSDYLQLAPGASRSATINLASLYQMSATGAYTVRYHANALGRSGGGAGHGADELRSAPVSIWVDAEEAITPDP